MDPRKDATGRPSKASGAGCAGCLALMHSTAQRDTRVRAVERSSTKMVQAAASISRILVPTLRPASFRGWHAEDATG